jgi:hypothetical protein
MRNTRSGQIDKWKKIIIRRMRINSLANVGPLFSAKHMIAQLRSEHSQRHEADSLDAIYYGVKYRNELEKKK